MIELRDYQATAMREVRAAFKVKTEHGGRAAVLLYAPTGAGKTRCIASLAEGLLLAPQKDGAAPARLLITCPTIEIIRQVIEELESFSIPHGVIARGYVRDPGKRVQVGSLPLLARNADRPWAQGYTVMVIDEAQHSVARMCRKLIDANADSYVFGVTGGPTRLDGRGLGRSVGGVYDVLVQTPGVQALTKLGHLVPARVYAPPLPAMSKLDRSTLVAGDFDRALADAAMTKEILGDAIRDYLKYAPGKKGICFCSTIEKAEQMEALFNAQGIPAIAASSRSSGARRRDAITGLGSGKYTIVCAVDLISEGLNVPGVEVIISLRPTASLMLWIQQVGRGLRKFLGKTELVIIDHAGNTLRHGLPDREHVWSLEGRPRQEEEPPEILTCPGCAAAYESGRPPACKREDCPLRRDGPRPPPRPGPRERPGELEEMSAESFEQWKREIRRQLLRDAQAQGTPFPRSSAPPKPILPEPPEPPAPPAVVITRRSALEDVVVPFRKKSAA